MSKKNDERKNVVIVGAGGAGAVIARLLSKKLDASKYDLILINPRPYRILLPATARLTVSDIDNLKDTALVPFDKNFHNGNGNLLIGKVASIEKSTSGGGVVVLENGDRISYAVLVLTPGALWTGPLAFPDDPKETTAFIEQSQAKFANAKDIVLVGGGAVGIEFAGEIKDIWPAKNVTIVQGDNMLLNKTYPDRFRKGMEQRVRQRGINIVFDDFVDDTPEEGTYSSIKTRSGKTIKADLVLTTRGPTPATAFVQSLGSDVLNERGLIKVKPTLQLKSFPDIFAAGDVVDIKEEKQLVKAMAHAEIVTANVIVYLTGASLSSMKKYKGSRELIVVTLGKGGGMGYFQVLWGIVLGDWFARLAKSKTLMVSQMRESLGY